VAFEFVVAASGHLDDMTGLPELSETSILKNLQARYAKEIIYTYTGTILVACNPYKWISIYEDVSDFSPEHLFSPLTFLGLLFFFFFSLLSSFAIEHQLILSCFCFFLCNYRST